jgi:hypothetical protein
MCAICGPRPPKSGHRYCENCESKLAKEKRSRSDGEPVKFATYKGYVVGFYRTGTDGKLIPRLLKRKPEGLPKSRTLDCNTYIEGFTREQVKRIKSTILALAEC